MAKNPSTTIIEKWMYWKGLIQVVNEDRRQQQKSAREQWKAWRTLLLPSDSNKLPQLLTSEEQVTHANKSAAQKESWPFIANQSTRHVLRQGTPPYGTIYIVPDHFLSAHPRLIRKNSSAVAIVILLFRLSIFLVGQLVLIAQCCFV